MRIKHSILYIFLSFFLCVNAQYSLADLKAAGINSEEDLKGLGFSDSDISQLKEQLQSSTVSSETAGGDAEQEVVNEDVVEPNVVKPTQNTTPSTPAKNQVYGKTFFDNRNLKVYENATHIKAPDNYVLGAGDEISINIWGTSEHSGRYTVGENGSIRPKLVGNIFLNGVTFKDAKKIIKSRFSRSYSLSNSNISIELNYSKVIRVNIVGEVNNPGTYTVPSINSAFNILSLSGGISELGSVRNIYVLREGKVVKTLDVYDFLMNPKETTDYFLLDNDYLVVSSSKKRIKLDGEVGRSGIYELTDDEGIKALIEIAGGVNANGYTKVVNVNRYIDNKDVLVEIPFDSLMSNNKDFKLLDGDRVFVKKIPSQLRNVVSVSGAVGVQGDFSFEEGMTVKNLLTKAQGLNNDAYLDRAYIRRRNNDFSFSRVVVNLEKELSGTTATTLQEFDDIQIFSKQDFVDSYFVEISGAVRNPLTTAFSEGMTLGDLIMMAGGLERYASISNVEVSRIFENGDSATEARIVLKNIESDFDWMNDKNQNFKLNPGDIVIFRSVPTYKKQSFVTVVGEVEYPGTYALKNHDEKITDLIARSGGVTDWAFLEGAYIKRRRAIDGGALTVVNLKKLLDKSADKFDYYLEDGDSLFLPSLKDFVRLTGYVRYPKVSEYGAINTPFHERRRAKFYVNEYGGGFEKDAAKANTYVESAGGYVKRTRNFWLFKIYPIVKVGDKIVVVKKPEKVKDKTEKKPVDWNRVIENTTVKLTGFATLYILMQNLFTN